MIVHALVGTSKVGTGESGHGEMQAEGCHVH